MNIWDRIKVGLFKHGGRIRIKEVPPVIEALINDLVEKAVKRALDKLMPKPPAPPPQ